jgi:hypothetical protein
MYPMLRQKRDRLKKESFHDGSSLESTKNGAYIIREGRDARGKALSEGNSAPNSQPASLPQGRNSRRRGIRGDIEKSGATKQRMGELAP